MKNSCETSASTGQRSKRARQTQKAMYQQVASDESLSSAALELATAVRHTADSWDRWSIAELRDLGAATKRIGRLADRYLQLKATHDASESSGNPGAQGTITAQAVTHEFTIPHPSGSVGMHLSFGDPLLVQEIDLGLLYPVPTLPPGYVWALLWSPYLAGMQTRSPTEVPIPGVGPDSPRVDPTHDASNYEVN